MQHRASYEVLTTINFLEPESKMRHKDQNPFRCQYLQGNVFQVSIKQSKLRRVRMKTSKASELSEYLRENYPVNKASISQRKMKYGVGINNADYLTQPRVNGKQIKCQVYVAWSGILMRVYYENKRKDNLAYADCKVCDEWLTFNNFREWYLKNHVDGYEIDKDLLLPKTKFTPQTPVSLFLHG